MKLLTATYDFDYKRIVMHYMANGNAEFVTMGPVTDAEIQTAFAAEGGNVAGWTVTLSW
jgi:hypothetical protein